MRRLLFGVSMHAVRSLGLVMSMVFTTAFLAADLPKEYRTGGDRVLVLVGPIIIGVVAVSWLVHAFFDKERR